jgi:hypothetical protein
LLELLDAIQRCGLRTVSMKVDADRQDTYNIASLYEFLETLATLVTLTDADLTALEEKYEDVRKDVVKIVSRLAEIVASLSPPRTGGSGRVDLLF